MEKTQKHGSISGRVPLRIYQIPLLVGKCKQPHLYRTLQDPHHFFKLFSEGKLITICILKNDQTSQKHKCCCVEISFQKQGYHILPFLGNIATYCINFKFQTFFLQLTYVVQ